MLGCILGNDVAVRTLLENKAEMGLKDYEGNTALHHACIFNHRMIVKILLEHYFPMNMKNDKGMLAYQCISGRSEDIVKMFGGFSQE